jgi:hypothetical protein
MQTRNRFQNLKSLKLKRGILSHKNAGEGFQ